MLKKIDDALAKLRIPSTAANIKEIGTTSISNISEMLAPVNTTGELINEPTIDGPNF